MLKRIFAYCLLMFMSGHAVGQTIDNNHANYDLALSNCIEKQFTKDTSPTLNKELDLVESCPDLSIILATRNNKDFIQPPLKSKTTLNRLLDERALREQTYQVPTSTATNLELVTQLAKNYDFDSPKAEAPGWWQRLKQWLKDKYGNQEEDANIDWLLKLLDDFSMPDWLYNSILYGSIALVILLAIIIIANEFRHYKRYKNRDEHSESNDALAELHALRKLGWDEIQLLPLKQKTGALLQYLIQQCINREWLPDNNSFTNREFYRALKKLDASKASRFNKVVDAAEQAIYGQHPLNEKELRKIILVTEEILNVDEAKPA